MATIPQRPAEEDLAKGAPSASRENRFPQDRYLRAFGFRIHSRRNGREAVWVRNGQLFLQSEALDLLSHELDGKEQDPSQESAPD